MRRYLHVPQVAAVMGSCIAGGAYLPALSDVIFMVEGTSFMGLGGPNLVKGATGQTIDAETLGGARTHTELSAVAHYRAANDAECLDPHSGVRQPPAARTRGCSTTVIGDRPPARPLTDLYDILPHDHRLSYDMRHVLAACSTTARSTSSSRTSRGRCSAGMPASRAGRSRSSPINAE